LTPGTPSAVVLPAPLAEAALSIKSRPTPPWRQDFMDAADSVTLKHRALEEIAIAALNIARRLMETGARAEIVHDDCAMVALGLGAERVDLRSGYRSLDITVGSGLHSVTRMTEVGALGVNYRLNHAIRKLAQRIGDVGATPADAIAELSRLEAKTRRHPPWLVALAVGVACAGFGRLLGIDWAAFAPVTAAGAIGQAARHALLQREANVFVVAAVIAFLAAALGGLLAMLAGSATIELAMTASVLLLVPGVPALNAQSDIMEGYPTLGSARAVTVVMLLLFIAIGALLAQGVLGVPR
jgi:uncharacterized membrane protein YjjP (DUF1212 family)